MHHCRYDTQLYRQYQDAPIRFPVVGTCCAISSRRPGLDHSFYLSLFPTGCWVLRRLEGRERPLPSDLCTNAGWLSHICMMDMMGGKGGLLIHAAFAQATITAHTHTYRQAPIKKSKPTTPCARARIQVFVVHPIAHGHYSRWDHRTKIYITQANDQPNAPPSCTGKPVTYLVRELAKAQPTRG